MKWLIFAENTKHSTIQWHLARNEDVVGYFTCIPPYLQKQAEQEQWDLPYVWVETVETVETVEGGV